MSDRPDFPPVDDADIPFSSNVPEEELPPEPRLERQGGEPAPDITPEEFARLQEAGQLHLDPRGRVRPTRSESDAGISLRRRRAWYGGRRA